MHPINKLLEGYGRFRQRFFDQDPQLFRELSTRGQSPQVAIVACCDSRVDPAIVFDCSPGDLFTIRNVANLVPPHEPSGTYHGTSAALEFAVGGLKVRHILVLGHAQCGGIRALMAAPSPQERKSDFIDAWVNIAAGARERVLEELPGNDFDTLARACELASIRVSLENLMTFPWIRERVERGELFLHGWYFDLESGELQRLGADGEFHAVAEEDT